MHQTNLDGKVSGVSQWVARLTRNRSVVSSSTIKGLIGLFTLVALYWLVPGTDLSVTHISKNVLLIELV